MSRAWIRGRAIAVHYQFDRQLRPVSPTVARFRRRGGENWALRGVDIDVEAGEGVALLGASGSGKTTLLRTLAGVLVPDEGRLEVEGVVGSLLSVQAGVMARLTGRENVMLLGVLAGLLPEDAEAEVDAVRETSGLGKSFDRLVSSYSQGMRARLGLAIAERTEPDVLLLDEIHEALDHEYREHVERLADGLRERGGIVVATGHDHHILERLCPRAVLLEQGHIRADGPFKGVQREYLGDRAA